MDLLSGIEGAIGGIASAFEGGSGGGNFLSELMDVFGGGSQSQGSGGGSGTMGEIGQIAQDVLPLAMAFL
jgi:hypothetical protein